jgi:replication-associated recombination protein RarA
MESPEQPYLLPNDPMNLRTKRGYQFSEVSSAMQKAIRRADAKLAGYWALELWESGFGKYCWKRLLTVSAEDCWGILTAEVKALHDAYLVVNEGLPAKQHRGRIFISKAVILLCLAKKSRDADHLQNFVYDQTAGLDPEELRTTCPFPATPMTVTRGRDGSGARRRRTSSRPSRRRLSRSSRGCSMT